MKSVRILVLLFMGFFTQAFAQQTQPDSATLKTETAKTDAKYFRLNKRAIPLHRKHLLLRTSDYFKPTSTTVVNPKWINDSTYVTSYKLAAYQESLKQRTTGHNVLVAGGIVVGVYVIGFIIFLAVVFKAF